MRKTKEKSFAIGVFDSGLGGLTVVRELMRCLPQEHVVYFGDTARVPYGTKSKDSIIRFSQDNVNVLLKYNVKIIVVACNSSASYAMPMLRKNFNIPIVGVITPGSQKAIKHTKNKKIGVIATSATIKSGSYLKTIRRMESSVNVFSKACPLFVPLVEEGWLDVSITKSVVKEYLTPLKQQQIDTLILGCTHYPLLKKAIASVMGKKVFLVDSAQEVAAQVDRLLDKLDLRRTGREKAKHKFLVSDRPQDFKKIARNFLGQDINPQLIKF